MFGNLLGWASHVQRHGKLAMLTALTAAVVGCGASDEQKAGGSAHAVPVDQNAAVVAALPTQTGQGSDEGEVFASVDSLPPEIDVTVADTVVVPGAAIEITALGSPDVRDVVLMDGMGKSTSFVYDLQAKAWRTFYRVPMKNRTERLGLSVTAKNDGHRWRRVWLFLRIEKEGLTTQPGRVVPDSTQR